MVWIVLCYWIFNCFHNWEHISPWAIVILRTPAILHFLWSWSGQIQHGQGWKETQAFLLSRLFFHWACWPHRKCSVSKSLHPSSFPCPGWHVYKPSGGWFPLLLGDDWQVQCDFCSFSTEFEDQSCWGRLLWQIHMGAPISKQCLTGRESLKPTVSKPLCFPSTKSLCRPHRKRTSVTQA